MQTMTTFPRSRWTDSTWQALSTTKIVDDGPHFELLSRAGYQISLVDRTKNLWDPETLIEQLQGCSAIVAGLEPYPRNVLEALPELRVIARTGVGYDAIDVNACDDLGIAVATTPGVNHDAVAEHTIALLMAVSRGFPGLDQMVRSGRWTMPLLPRVKGKKLGLIGLGRTGKAVASRAIGLGMEVLAYEPFPGTEPMNQIRFRSLPEVLSESDYVSLHNPLTSDTVRMMNAVTFSQMKQGSVFINTARGGLVDEQALAQALQSGHLRAAALDVYEQEPLPLTSSLLQLPNVLFAPHCAGVDLETVHEVLSMAADTIICLKNGRFPCARIQNLKQLTQEFELVQ